MENETDETAQAAFSNLRLCLRMIMEAMTASVKTEWKRGTKIPLLLHGRRRRRFWHKSTVPTKLWITPMLVIQDDQTTTCATDLVKCCCLACGKRVKLNAGYIEALSLLFAQAEYLRGAE